MSDILSFFNRFKRSGSPAQLAAFNDRVFPLYCNQ